MASKNSTTEPPECSHAALTKTRDKYIHQAKECLVGFSCLMPNRVTYFVWITCEVEIPQTCLSVQGQSALLDWMETALPLYQGCTLLRHNADFSIHIHFSSGNDLLLRPISGCRCMRQHWQCTRQSIRINFKRHLSWGYSTTGLDQSVRGNNLSQRPTAIFNIAKHWPGIQSGSATLAGENSTTEPPTLTCSRLGPATNTSIKTNKTEHSVCFDVHVRMHSIISCIGISAAWHGDNQPEALLECDASPGCFDSSLRLMCIVGYRFSSVWQHPVDSLVVLWWFRSGELARTIP